jgi:hypothetical protein
MLKSVSSITNAIGALNFKGTWDANANSPALASSVGTKGDYYVVGTAGSTNLNGISNWGVGDLATFNGSVWQRVEGGADLNGVNLSVSGTSTLSGLTASTALALNASKEIVSVTNTGTGNNVLETSPTLTTPILGVASATSINKVAITAPATSATLTIANNKTLTANNSLTIAGTDATTMTFPATSATIARTDAANNFTGNQTFGGDLIVTNGKITSASFGTIAIAGNYVITLAPIVSGILSYEIELVGAGNNNTRAVYFVSSRVGSVNATSLSASTQGLGATHTVTAGSDGSNNLTITIANTNAGFAETGVWTFVGTFI